MSGAQGVEDVNNYMRMLTYNQLKKSRFDNIYAQQTPSSRYFKSDKLGRDKGVILNMKHRVRLLKNPEYLRRFGIPVKEITPATVLFPLTSTEIKYRF